MAITLGELLIKLTAKTDAFQKGMTDAKKLAFDSSSDIVSSLGRIGESLGKLKFDNLNQVAASLNRVGGIVAGVAIGVATASIAAAEHVALTAKEIDKLSQSYGLSVQQISAFRVASTITGVSLDTITSGMSRLAKNAATVAEAVGGHTQKGAAAAFNALHLSVTDSQGKLLPLNDLLGSVAEKFSHMQDSTTKTALAIQIFGKGGAALIPFLNEGKEGLERLRQVSDDLGLTWSEKDVQAARQFGESVEILKLKSQSFEEQLARGLYPALNQIVTAFGKVDNGQVSLANSIGTGIGDAFKQLAKLIVGTGIALDIFYLKAKRAVLFGPEGKIKGLDTDPKTSAYAAGIEDINKQITELEVNFGKFLILLDTPSKTYSTGKSGPVPGLGKPEDIHKVTEELRALSDETAKLLAKFSGDESAQKILALNVQIGKLRDFGTDHQKLGDSFLTEIANQIERLGAEIDQLNLDKLKAFYDSIRQPLPASIFNTQAAGNLAPRPQAPTSFLQYDLAIKQLEKLHAAHEINDEDYEKERTALQEGARVFGQSLTTAQRYNEELANLNRLLGENAISQDVFNRAVTSLGKISTSALKGAKAFFQEYADYAKETGRQVYEALASAFSKLEDTLADFFTKGKADWKALFDSIQTDIVKIAIKGLITGPLAKGLGKLFGITKRDGSSKDAALWVQDANSSPLGGGAGTPAGTDKATSSINGIFAKLWDQISGLFKNLGSILSKVFSSIGSFFGGIFGGGRASGGPVSAGTLYRVNENQTEYFKPNVGGHIIPLGPQMAMAGGAPTINYYITTPDVDGFKKSQSQIINSSMDAASRAQRRR